MSDNVKTVALFNDLCGMGRCSLSVAIPIVSAFGLQPIPVPTALLSCHTGYENFSFTDFTPYFSDYIASLKKQSQSIDAVYTGFVGSYYELDDIINYIKSANKFLLVDPVMGDNGKAYSTYTGQMCSKMKELVAFSDVTTPNLTEACILTDTEFKSEFSDDEIKSIAKKVCSLGAKACVITGIVSGDFIKTYVYADGLSQFVVYPKTEIMYDGTGDIFASVLCGGLLKGKSLLDAVDCACGFVSKTTKYTMALGTPQIDGIAFEPLLKELL